jgi:hypothetical protein
MNKLILILRQLARIANTIYKIKTSTTWILRDTLSF